MHKLEPCPCPVCDIKLDASTSVSEEDVAPTPGDVTVCAYCQSVLEFTEDMTYKQISITDLPEEVQNEVAIAIAYIEKLAGDRTYH